MLATNEINAPVSTSLGNSDVRDYDHDSGEGGPC